MAYNPKLEKPVWLSLYHHRLAQAIAELPTNKRNKRAQIELIIEQAAKEAGVLELVS